jgi:hypothetical protein
MKQVSTRDSWNHWWIEFTVTAPNGYRIRKYCGWIEWLYQLFRRKPRVPEIAKLEVEFDTCKCGRFIIPTTMKRTLSFYLVEAVFTPKAGQCDICNRADYDKWVLTDEGQKAMRQIEQNWAEYFRNV